MENGKILEKLDLLIGVYMGNRPEKRNKEAVQRDNAHALEDTIRYIRENFPQHSIGFLRNLAATNPEEFEQIRMSIKPNLSNLDFGSARQDARDKSKYRR